MNFKPQLRRAAVAAAIGFSLLVALAGCLKIDLDVAVSNDDTVSGTYVYALFDDTGTVDGSTIEALETDEYVSAEDFNDGTYTGKKYTITDQPIDLFFDTNTTQAVLSISRDGDDIVVSGQLDLTDSDSDPAMVEERRSQADVRIRITLPGDIYQADGSISGNTITWVGEWDENTPINARSFSPEGGVTPAPTSSATATATPSASPSEAVTASPSVTPTEGELIAPPLDGEIDETTDALAGFGLALVIGLAVLGLLLVAVIVLLIVLLNRRKRTFQPSSAPETNIAADGDAEKTQILPQQPKSD